MRRHIPYDKLSKKEKRKRDALRRGTWGGINPVTRKAENPKAYKRKKVRPWEEEASLAGLFCTAGLSVSRKCPRVETSGRSVQG